MGDQTTTIIALFRQPRVCRKDESSGVNMYEYNATILRVVDGDTAKVDIDLGFGMSYKNQTIRFYGIDTEESRTRDLTEKWYGKLAAQYVKDRLIVAA